MISGYERNVEEARQTVQQLVSELQEMVSQDVHLDPRTHARIIGARGKAIRKLMEEFKVRLPPRHQLLWVFLEGFKRHSLFPGGYSFPSAWIR